MKKIIYTLSLILISTSIYAQRHSHEVKYFVSQLDKVVQLTEEQKTALLDMASENEMKKLYFKRELKKLSENKQGNSAEAKKIKLQIRERTKEEEANLIKLLTPEQHQLYLKDKSKRKFENQANALTTLLSLTPKQRPEVLDLISNNGLRQDSIKKELKVAKALKDNKVVKKLMTAMTNQAITFDTSLVNLLTPQQIEIFVKDRIDKKLKGKLKRFQVEQKITDSDLLAIKELMIEHQYKKSTLIKANQNRIISDAETKTLERKLQKILTTEQFAEYQKKFAK